MSEETIQDYVLGKLSAEEAAIVAAEVVQNYELAEMVRTYELIFEGYRQQRIQKLKKSILNYRASKLSTSGERLIGGEVYSEKHSLSQDPITTGSTISIIHGNEDVLSLLSTVLERDEGLTVDGAYRSAEEALEKVLLNKPDVIITEISLPGMNGLDLMMRLHKTLTKTLFLALTVFDTYDSVINAFRSGADGYVLTSEGPSGIRQAVQDLLNGKVPISRSIAPMAIHSWSSDQEMSSSFRLNDRQKEILSLLKKGVSTAKEIAHKLGIKEGVVRQHLYKLLAQIKQGGVREMDGFRQQIEAIEDK